MTSPARPPLQTTQNPLRIGIAGAGAIGGLLAARLGTAGHRVSMLARGRTLDVLAADGVSLDDLHGSTRVRVHASQEADFGTQDVLFLCSKAQDLRDLARAALPMVGPETIIVPTPNGVPFWYFQGAGRRFDGQAVEAVDPGGELLSLLPMDQVVGTALYITAEAVTPGRIVSGNPHLMVLGEPRGGLSERVSRLAELMTGAGIEGRAVEQIRDPLWTKIIANMTSNLISVVSGATLQDIFSREDLVPRTLAVMHEVMLAAACHGARLSIDPIEFLELGAAMGPVRTSMLQDFLRGRPLELAAIGQSVLELANKYSLPMTATRELFAQVCAAERGACAARSAQAA